MDFAENLKRIRKENNLSQEEIAEIMNVSRQSVSKYEQGKTYPEVEKLIQLSKELNITIDSLLRDDETNVINKREKAINTERQEQHLRGSSNQKIYIRSYDGKTLVSYYKFNISHIFRPTEKQPKCTLMGVYKHTFWGEYSNMLGFYGSHEDAIKEIQEIKKSLNCGEGTYELKYYAKVKNVGIDVHLDN